ncbi:microcephalin isoform X2 [Sphaerodactylus townsendi]|uniref:microcephalin isoform X2 n=1 Tax=Sphaerodactylus townsendi TaxID=933632 RepID=UPI0020263149|nr:microcephalin isoform X2 [Sphaerodactylus townsendi]
MESSNGRPCARLILSGVVAYVDVWSSNRTENYSKGFIQQLLDMGAKVSKTFSKQVTHVVFKEGHWSTWNKAQKTGIKLVSVLWVEKCREVRACVDESLYPAINTNEGLPQQIRKHKCMQPRDFVEKTPENDRRLQKKLRTMAKDLEVQKATTEVDIPVLLFEDDGSLFYSPTSKIQYESSSMEKRIMDMKERRENLSPTASQMSQVSGSSSVQATQEPVIVSASSTWVLSEEESGGSLNSSFTNLWGNSEHKGLWKDSSKSSLEVLNTPVSSAALGGSPFLTDDWNHASPKQPRDKHLQKRRIRPKTLERDFLNKRAESEMPTPEKHDDRNDHLPHKKKLDCRRSSEKVIQVEIAESSNDHSHSETDAEYFTDFASTNLTFSPLKSNCVFGSKQTPKRRSRIKLNTSALCRRDSENDFLKAVLTPNKSTKDQGSSYEDYFSESNLNRGKVSLPLSSLQKLQSSSERVYKCSPSQSEQGAMLQKSSTNEKSVSRKRKKVAENNENVAGSSYIQSVFPNSKESATLNCMLEGEKVNTAESPEYFLNLDVQQKMHITVANRCHLTTGDENKLCKFDGNDDYLEVREPNKKLQTTGRIKKPLRTLVMTSMCSEQKNTVVQVAKKLGNFLFSNEVCENTSHVISGSPRRTLNVLLGIARGCWIVSFEWVLWSLEYGHWISEEPYELSVDFPAAPICRVQQYLSETNNKKLFSDQPVMFVSLTSQPPFYKLCELIQLCGGKLCKTIRQAEICIGKCRVGRHRGIQCLSEKWILDSVIQNKICPLGRYIYQNKD